MFKNILLLVLFLSSLVAKEATINTKDIYLKSYNYEYMGKYNEAIKVLAPLYDKYPNGYTLNLRFGYLFLMDKKYSNANKYYKKASLAVPSSIEPRLALANIKLKLEEYEDAQTLAYNILKIDYYNYYGNLYAINSLIGQKKYDTALLITNKMLSLYPTSIIFLEKLAIIYKSTKHKYLDEVYKSIEILDPNNVLVNTNLK
jgi:tetratricopeptide (TPR) repeat protein